MTGWRCFFAAAACFNVAIASGYIAAPGLMLTTGGMPSSPPDLGWRLLGWCVLTFGVGYALVALRPDRNDDLVRLGVIGKLGVFATVLACWPAGLASGPLLAGGCADLLWALAFLIYLRRPAASMAGR